MDGDKNLVDLAFAGEDLDFIYVMSETNLYKLSGLIENGSLFQMLNCYYLVVQEWESPEEMSPTLLGLLIFRRSEDGGGNCRFKILRLWEKIQDSFRCFIYNNDANLT